jgi:hypothetical protein
VLLVHRSSFVPYALTGAAWLACFTPLSLATTGHVLPRYFRETKTFSLHGFPEGFAGVLVSPSRGLLVYSPAIVAIAWLVVRGRGKLAWPRLAVLAAAVTCGHLIVLGLYPKWSGGSSYGARYATDVVPWLFLLAVLGWRAAIGSRSHSFLARAAGALLIAASVFVQAPGAVSHGSWLWNTELSPEHLWDWTDPQFLHWKHPSIRGSGASQATGRVLGEHAAPPPVESMPLT